MPPYYLLVCSFSHFVLLGIMMAGVTRVLCIIPLPSKFCLCKFDATFGSKHSVLQRYVDQVYLF